MQNLLNDLVNILKKDKRLFVDGELLKNKTQELALANDEELLKNLIANKKIKDNFFVSVAGALIFDKDKFIKFISNKEFLPDSYTAFKNKIGLTEGDEYLSLKKDVVLSWPYKDCVLEGGQTKEDAKRNEIFWNETLAPDDISRLFEPKVLTNFKRGDKNGEKSAKEIKDNDNLIIKGNNLLALHSLKEKFRNKVKLIYIDPPYNTGNDSFGYNDSFNHSTWLTFMKNRLEIARELLKDDGVIFIQINDIEQAHLKIICDDIFGRENFHTTICVQMSHLSGVKMAHKEVKLPKIKEFILFYTKTNKIKLNPQYSPATWDEALERYKSFINKNGFSDDECKKWEVITLTQAMKKNGVDLKDKKAISKFKIENANLIFRTAVNRGADYSKYPKDKISKITNPDNSYYFIYKNEDINFAADKVIEIRGAKTPVVALGDIWTDIGINNLSNEGRVDLRFGKKPEKLIERVIKLCTDENDLVLDFFGGSGTTAAIAHKINRRYILIEQLEEHIKKTTSRLQNVINGEDSGISKENDWKGGGEFVYCELMNWNEQYIDKIKKAKNKSDIKKIWTEIKDKGYLFYKLDIKKIDASAKDFESLSLYDQKRFLLEALDKNQLYVNLGDIDDKDYKVSAKDKKLNKMFYNK